MKLLQVTWAELLTVQLAYRSIPYNGKLVFAKDFWLDERTAKECGAYELFSHVSTQIIQLPYKYNHISCVRTTNNKFNYFVFVKLFSVHKLHSNWSVWHRVKKSTSCWKPSHYPIVRKLLIIQPRCTNSGNLFLHH